MPRFVILEHDHPTLHWDLMLETNGVLQTWRLTQPPVERDTIQAAALDDHRLAHLDFEGKLAGNRGSVRRWDVGEFEEPADSLPSARRLILRGLRLDGEILLERIEGTQWRFSRLP